MFNTFFSNCKRKKNSKRLPILFILLGMTSVERTAVSLNSRRHPSFKTIWMQRKNPAISNRGSVISSSWSPFVFIFRPFPHACIISVYGPAVIAHPSFALWLHNTLSNWELLDVFLAISLRQQGWNMEWKKWPPGGPGWDQWWKGLCGTPPVNLLSFGTLQHQESVYQMTLECYQFT